VSFNNDSSSSEEDVGHAKIRSFLEKSIRSQSGHEINSEDCAKNKQRLSIIKQ
jgi:hypothetical protein